MIKYESLRPSPPRQCITHPCAPPPSPRAYLSPAGAPVEAQAYVRDRLMDLIVQLTGESERWDTAPVPYANWMRFRQGLICTQDPMVIAVRRAVLDQCDGVRGPSPGQGARCAAKP